MRRDPRSDPFAQPGSLFQRRVRRVFSGGGDAAHEDRPGKTRPFEAFDPALQTADGAPGDLVLRLGGGGQEIHVAESVIAGEKRLRH